MVKQYSLTLIFGPSLKERRFPWPTNRATVEGGDHLEICFCSCSCLSSYVILIVHSKFSFWGTVNSQCVYGKPDGIT